MLSTVPRQVYYTRVAGKLRFSVFWDNNTDFTQFFISTRISQVAYQYPTVLLVMTFLHCLIKTSTVQARKKVDDACADCKHATLVENKKTIDGV